MSLVQQISAMVDTTVPQWRAEKLQVVNWGGFHGHAIVNFSPDVTVISGQSGAGKSTLLDAYIALMMPPNVAFNGASNDSGGGRARSAEQRNLLSYLRGKLDDTLEDGEVVDDVLRGRREPTWGAVSMTFASDVGKRFTAMRAYFVPARASRAAEISMRFMAIEDEFDLRDLKDFAQMRENHFPPRELKSTWTEMRTFESYSSFSQALYQALGIGMAGDGANALRLLARIQASEDIPTVDRLYKELVIEKPESYDKADAAIEHFDRLEDVYQEMVTAQARADLLEPITEAHEALVRAQEAIEEHDELGALDAETTPAGLWRLRRHSRVLEAAVEKNRAVAQNVRAARRSAGEREQAFRAQLEAAKKSHSEAGGGLLIELGRQISNAAERVDSREERRRKLIEATMVVGEPMTSQAEFELAQQRAREFLAEYPTIESRLTAERDQVLRADWPIANRLKEIRTELTSLETRSGRTEQHLEDLRQAAAAASGLPVAELPFVSELIDVMRDEEYWRTAIETSLHGGARLMLVPLEHLEHFSAAIDPLHLKGRLNFEGVQRSEVLDQRILDPDRVAGKLVFKESPYQKWVTDHVSHPSRNALCVQGPGQLNGEELRITPAGQTRRRRGGSHGRASARNVIGFSNDDLRSELATEQEELQTRQRDAQSEASRIAEELRLLGDKKGAYLLINSEAWAQIDVASAVAEKDELTRQRNEIRDNDDVLASLDRQINSLGDALEEVQHERHRLDDEITALDEKHAEYVDQEDLIHPVISRIADDYQGRWESPNLGTTIEFYDDYAAILDEIVRSGLRERRDEWRRRLVQWSGEHLQQLATALNAAVEEIEDRLAPINQILRDLPFGPTNDRLFIHLRRLQPEAVVIFRRELSRHAQMATSGDGDDELEKRFTDLQRFMAQIRRKDDVRLARDLVETADRDRLLDVRRHVDITAQRRNLAGEVLSIYQSLQGKSGGEMQELIAFIVGSALRFQLGDQLRSRPRFAPVFLDEGFIKADGQFTARAVQAWRGLGFQLIIGAPVDKAPALEPHADVIVEIAKNLATHKSYVLQIRGLESVGAKP